MAPPRFSGSPSLSTEALAQLLLPPLRSLENRLPAQGQGLLSASWSHPQARACPVSCSALFSLKGEERASLSVPVPFQEGLPSTDSFLPSLAFSVCHYHYLSKWPHCSGKTLPSDSCCFRPLCFRQQDWLYNQSEVGLLFFAQPVLPEPSVI